MKYSMTIEHFLHDIIQFAKEFWFEVAVLCLFTAFVLAVGIGVFA